MAFLPHVLALVEGGSVSFHNQFDSRNEPGEPRRFTTSAFGGSTHRHAATMMAPKKSLPATELLSYYRAQIATCGGCCGGYLVTAVGISGPQEWRRDAPIKPELLEAQRIGVRDSGSAVRVSRTWDGLGFLSK